MNNALRVTSHEARENNRDAMHRRSATFLLATRTTQLVTRHGVTLIELLITITIISILSATFLGVSNLAMESAREARTKTTIGKLHSLLMEKWSSYATRRVDIKGKAVRAKFLPNRKALGIALADTRLLATRELMKLEMPDRWSDILGDTVTNVLPTAVDSAFIGPTILPNRPALTVSYLRRYRSLPTTDVESIQSNQGAECLYMIIMMSTADGEARSLFSEQDIGDTDNDGALEFLDGWGRSIQFVRWPAGFVSRSDIMPGDPDADHDPTDPFRRDTAIATGPKSTSYPYSKVFIDQLRDPQAAFRIVPLIYSRGPDGSTDMVISKDVLVGLDPYAAIFGKGAFANSQLARVVDLDNDGDNSLDNIHNHLQNNK